MLSTLMAFERAVGAGSGPISFLSVVGCRLRAQQTAVGRLAFEGFLVVAAVSVVGVSVGAVSAGLVIDRYPVHNFLSLLAAGVGAAAVGFGQAAGRLSGNRRANWLIPALALYCGVIIPGTAHLPTRPEDASSSHIGMLVAYVALVGLLLAAIRPPAKSGSRVGWVAAVGAALVALTLIATAEVHPGGLAAMVPLPVDLIVLIGWCSVSTAIVVAGLRVSSAPLWRVGLGFGVIAVAHLYRLLRAQPAINPSLVFAALSLVGVGVVMLGMAQLLRRAVKTTLGERFAHQEELRVANLRADALAHSAAVREHELRNGLSGLSGMSRLLSEVVVDPAPQHLPLAVRHELDRLHDILDNDPMPATEIYDASTLLRAGGALAGGRTAHRVLHSIGPHARR